MQEIFRFLRLVLLIIRKGKFRHTGVDYSRKRKEGLEGLVEFCPVGSNVINRVTDEKKAGIKNSFSTVAKGELAFLRNRLKSQGGHITAPRINLSYVRIPKAASTAISSAILHERYSGLKRATLSPEKINYLADVNLNTLMMAGEEENTFFTLVRNPFARVVSVYREFVENKGDPFLYEDYLFGVFRQTVSFGDFVRTLHLIPDLLKDQHLRPQHLFLKYYQQKNVSLHIFKLEERSAWKDFLSAYSLQIESIHKSEAPYDYKMYFDTDTLQTVSSLYRADVLQFGYNTAYLELAQWVRNRTSVDNGSPEAAVR